MTTLFDLYLFADYSGALARHAQRRAIRLAQASPRAEPALIARRFCRNELAEELFQQLATAQHHGLRVCFGQDHQYSIPISLGRELSLGDKPWREVLTALCTGSYGEGAPPFAQPDSFCALFNAWLINQGSLPYFYSATKAKKYRIPATNPRRGGTSAYRWTERCRGISGMGSPKPLNRVGDNGAVGGQTIHGIVSMNSLLARCQSEGIRVAVWPFDGLSLTDDAYSNAHVMIEPYPSAVRAVGVAQSDDSDALASAAHVRELDNQSMLRDAFDLSALDNASGKIVRFEGWIASHRPNLTVLTAPA